MVSSNRYIYLKLNNYDYSIINLEKIFNYLKHQQIPREIKSPSDKNKFIKRWDKFIIRDNKLIYKDLDLEVVTDNKDDKMQLLYDNPKIGLGMSQTSFYQKVQQFYLNITRVEAATFLKKQPAYQLTTRTQPIVINKPFYAEYPNHRWATDLIDVNYWGPYNKVRNVQMKYILTVIDYFSRYVFAVALPNKEAQTIINAFEKIYNDQSHCYPVILQSDNGTEFKNGLFEQFCETNHIVLVYNKTYSPTGNALVENFNKYLRKLLNEGFIRKNRLKWVESLDDYLYNRNHTKHSHIKMLPADVWKPTNDKPIINQRNIIPNYQDHKLNDDEIQTKTLKTIQTAIQKKLKRYENDKLNVGDRVRVYLPSISPVLRKMIKNGEKKKIVNIYSPTVFTITKIIKKDEELERPKYFIDSVDIKGSFYFNELLKVDKDSPDIDIRPSDLNLTGNQKNDT